MAEQKKSYKKLLLYFWILFFGGVGLFALLMFSAAKSWPGFEPLPSFNELENPKSNLATEVYTSDGKILGKYFYQNRVNVDYEQLSPHLKNALISTEDERFFSHSGIDIRGLARAIINLGKSGGASTITQQLAKMLFHERGGSKWQVLKQKLQEWIIAAQLERRYTKEEIIAMYFNRVDFVNNAVGIKSAAKVYFNTSPAELKIEEAACLVGMLKNPSLFNPLRFPDTTLHRRNVALFQMKRNGQISETEFDSLRQIPLLLDYSKVDHKDGIAPYFREMLRAELKNLFNEKDENDEYVLQKANGEKYDMYKDGLKVFTTLDYTLQSYAEYAVTEHLSHELQEDFFNNIKRNRNNPFSSDLSDNQVEGIIRSAVKRSERFLIMSGKQCANCGRRGRFLEPFNQDGQEMKKCLAEDCEHLTKVHHPDSIEKAFNTPVPMKVFTWQGKIDTVLSPKDSIRYYKSFLQSGLMSMDPRTGYIKAWVGGINYEYFAYDHVRQGKRQVGSTFKPFVYTVAVDEGFSPCYEVPNVPVVFKKGEFGLLKDWAPKNSDGQYGGTVSLKYGLANSLNTVTAKLMKQFGPERVIKMARTMGITSHLDTVPSLALGVADVSIYEMVGAFSTFANKGVWTEPIFLTRIEDKDGNIIKDFIPKTREALSEETAYVMLDFLKGVTSYNYNKLKDKNVGGSGIRLTFPETKERPYAGITTPIAGKTGTTQNNSDGWFIGATPDLVTGVWVGAEDRSVRFSTTYMGQGANTGLPIFAYYMKKVYKDSTLNISKGDFEAPDKELSIELDCKEYDKNINFGGSDEPNFE